MFGEALVNEFNTRFYICKIKKKIKWERKLKKNGRVNIMKIDAFSMIWRKKNNESAQKAEVTDGVSHNFPLFYFYFSLWKCIDTFGIWNSIEPSKVIRYLYWWDIVSTITSQYLYFLMFESRPLAWDFPIGPYSVLRLLKMVRIETQGSTGFQARNHRQWITIVKGFCLVKIRGSWLWYYLPDATPC